MKMGRRKGEGLQLGLQPVGVSAPLMALRGQCVVGAPHLPGRVVVQESCPVTLTKSRLEQVARQSLCTEDRLGGEA